VWSLLQLLLLRFDFRTPREEVQEGSFYRSQHSRCLPSHLMTETDSVSETLYCFRIAGDGQSPKTRNPDGTRVSVVAAVLWEGGLVTHCNLTLLRILFRTSRSNTILYHVRLSILYNWVVHPTLINRPYFFDRTCWTLAVVRGGDVQKRRSIRRNVAPLPLSPPV
jgi:hypothetical protein